MNGVVITNNRCDPNGITGHASPSCQEPFRNQRDLTLWDNRIFIWHLPKFIEFSSFFGAKYSYLIVLMQQMLILCKILSEKSVHFSKNYSKLFENYHEHIFIGKIRNIVFLDCKSTHIYMYVTQVEWNYEFKIGFHMLR